MDEAAALRSTFRPSVVDQPTELAETTYWYGPPAAGERACCCSARPGVRAATKASNGHLVDLLLCYHHYRASAEKLAESGAKIFHLPLS